MGYMGILKIIYPKPYSIYLRGIIHLGTAAAHGLLFLGDHPHLEFRGGPCGGDDQSPASVGGARGSGMRVRGFRVEGSRFGVWRFETRVWD